MNKADQARAVLVRGRLVPVVRTATPEQAISASEALIDAGITAMEITLTVPGALRVIEQLAPKCGDRVLLGAGTVLDAESCRAAINAGARFIVSPSLRLETIAMARRYGALSLPGALTPTEALTAWESGADFVKIFPCDAVGGPKYIKALRGPLPQIPYVPTGGVSLETAESFLKAGATALGVGSDLVRMDDCRSGQWGKIRERGEQLRKIVEAFDKA